MTSLHSQHVVITGRSSGIGLATARAALDAGARVTLVARSAPQLDEAAIGLRTGARSSEVTARTADVLDFGRLRAVLAEIAPVDHVVNAAGSAHLGAVLAPDPIDDDFAAIDTRVRGSVGLVRAAHPVLRPDGSVVLIGGISTDRPVAGAWASSVGTAAAEQLARALALELAPLRVNAVSPGWTDTPAWSRLLGDQRDAVLDGAVKGHLTGRIVQPADVAAAVLLLLTNPSITGEILHVDAGARLT